MSQKIQSKQLEKFIKWIQEDKKEINISKDVIVKIGQLISVINSAFEISEGVFEDEYTVNMYIYLKDPTEQDKCFNADSFSVSFVLNKKWVEDEHTVFSDKTIRFKQAYEGGNLFLVEPVPLGQQVLENV